MIIFKGIIRNQEPIVFATIDSEGNLIFSGKGEYHFVVDTGFTGDIAVPHKLIPKLNLTFLSYDRFELATKKVIDLPVFQGWAKIDKRRVKVEIIPGDEIVGMSFLEAFGSKLVVDFETKEVILLE